MKAIARNKSDLILAFLYIESILLSLITENKGFFWMLFLLSTVTVFFYCLLFLEIHWKRILESEKRYDVALVVAMTVMFNANVMVFANRLLLGIIFFVYYLGVRYLMEMFKKGQVNQMQKNALNLSAIFIIFLGSNLLTNIAIAAQKGVGEIVVPIVNAMTFAFIYLISYYNFTKNKVAKKWTRAYSLVLALILTETAILSGFYLERYPTIYKAEGVSNMSIVTLPLFLVVIYYLVYGLMIHKLEKRMTPRVLMEYIGISVVIILTLFITIRWFAG